MSDSFEFPRIETERLLLRRFEARDLVPFMAYRNDPDINRYQGMKSLTEEQARAIIRVFGEQRAGIPGEWIQIAIERRDSHQLIGDCGLKIELDEPSQGEIGYRLSREHQGRGFATEAASAVLEYAFRTLGLHRMAAIVVCENRASIALLERLGFRREGRTIKSFWDGEHWIDDFLYGMLEEEWFARHPEASPREAG